MPKRYSKHNHKKMIACIPEPQLKHHHKTPRWLGIISLNMHFIRGNQTKIKAPKAVSNMNLVYSKHFLCSQKKVKVGECTLIIWSKRKYTCDMNREVRTKMMTFN